MKKQLISKKESELGGLENSQSIHTVKNEKACSEENLKSVTEQPFDKEITGAVHGLNQLSQQKPGLEMGL